MRKSEMDMLNGSIWDKMIIFALPLAFTGVLQQLYNAADVAVLGHFVSSNAMAAVGNNVPIIGMIVCFCMGLALGANVVVARYLGMKDDAAASRAVHTSFVVAVVFGVAMLLLGELLAGWLTRLMDVPQSVAGHSETYLRIYLVGMPFIAVYNFLGASFRSKGDTKTPLWALCAATVFNIVGNLLFAAVFDWGTAGVAWATVLANALSAVILFVKMVKSEGALRLDPAKIWTVDRECLRSMVRIGWPAGMQGAVFSLSNLLIQASINSLGADVMAGSVAGFTVEINVYCVINAFGLAATTFVSQNYGAGNIARCRRATWVCLGLNFAATFIMIAICMTFGHEILAGFSKSPEVIALGMTRLYYVVLAEPIGVVMEVLSDAMRGYGYSMPPAMVTLVCICTVRVIWVYTAFAWDSTYETLMLVYPISWAITAVALSVLYMRHHRLINEKHAVKI